MIILLTIVTVSYFNMKPRGESIHEVRDNAIWVGNRWFSGFDRTKGRMVTAEEKEIFIDNLRKRKISRVYCHVGAINIDGTLTMPSTYFFNNLQKESHDITYLPWLAGDAHKLDFKNPRWRSQVVLTLARLHAMGFSGIHLNFEPVQNDDEGYIALLREIRERFDDDFIISHATRRLTPSEKLFPLVKKQFWNRAYYTRLIESSDETVLMGYDTMLPFSKLYWAYISFQTRTLLNLATPYESHTVRIGIPSYEQGKRSNPQVENITNAITGIKDGLSRSGNRRNFGGISIYAYWLTNEEEWKEYEQCWLNPYSGDL